MTNFDYAAAPSRTARHGWKSIITNDVKKLYKIYAHIHKIYDLKSNGKRHLSPHEGDIELNSLLHQQNPHNDFRLGSPHPTHNTTHFRKLKSQKPLKSVMSPTKKVQRRSASHQPLKM